MIALVALNSFPTHAYSATRTHKIVQSAKQKKTKTRKKINKKLVRKRLITYGKSKGMTLDSKLTIKTSSWFPPTNIKHYKNNRELISAAKGDIRYLLDSFSDCEPSDISFNVSVTRNYLYILYA